MPDLYCYLRTFADQTISDHAVLRDLTKSSHGTGLPECAGQASGDPSGQLSLPGIDNAAGEDAGGGSSSALPEPITVPIQPSSRAISPHLARGMHTKFPNAAICNNIDDGSPCRCRSPRPSNHH